MNKNRQPCSGKNPIDIHSKASETLTLMNKTGNDRLTNIITLKDLLNFLSQKLDLEGEDANLISKDT